MAYNDFRSYVGAPVTIAAQNIIATASGQIVAGATLTALLPVAEATYVCSVAGVVTATPSTPPAGVKPYILSGTTTSTGTVAFAQSSASSGVCTFSPPVALSSGSTFQVGLVATGTASATQTAGAISLVVGVAPQFV